MSKVAVVYWTSTGNTEIMAGYVADGAKAAGAEVDSFEASEFSAARAADYSGIAFGCPAMGAEELEDSEFAPMFDDCKSVLGDKKVGLFGSYGWGDGEWMRTWYADCAAAGIFPVNEGVMANGEPDGEAEEACKALGAAIA